MVLGAFYPQKLLEIDTDILTLPTGMYINPRSAHGGSPADLPVDDDGVLLVFRPQPLCCVYHFEGMTDKYFGLQWYRDTIGWRKTTTTAL